MTLAVPETDCRNVKVYVFIYKKSKTAHYVHIFKHFNQGQPVGARYQKYFIWRPPLNEVLNAR